MPKANQKPKKTTKKAKKNASQFSLAAFKLTTSKSKIAAIFVLLFALVGSYLLYRSFAYSYPNTNWPLWAPRIRNCESTNNYKAQNSSSSASGAWQIIDGTWGHYKGYAHAKDAPNNIQDEKAYAIFQSSGTSPWKASYSCWKPYGKADSRPQPDPPLYIPSGGGQTSSSGGGTTSGCSNHPTIRQSATGGSECVKHLQSHLNSFGYNLSVDGAWGPNTNNAVRDFQSKHGLAVDGIVGPNTWNALHGSGGSSGSSAQPKGVVDQYLCANVAGWAYDPDSPNSSITVHVYVNGPAGSGAPGFAVSAKDSRPDVNQAFGISGGHGFNFQLPSQFRDGRAHSVYVYAINVPNGNNPQIGSGTTDVCR